MKAKLLPFALNFLVAMPVLADSSGTINATLTLTKGCLINGSSETANIDFGTLTFPSNITLFTSQITTSLTTSGGTSLEIQCSNNTTHSVKILNSTNAAPTTIAGVAGSPARYLLNGSDLSQGVAYSLYSDSAYSTVIDDNTTLTATTSTGGISTYILYGKITPGGDASSIDSGIYTDTINVQVVY